MLKITISRKAKKQLEVVPGYIYRKFLYWVDLVQTIGLSESRKFKGFKDESLQGLRKDQRSIRLSKGYRAIYIEVYNEMYEELEILEVSKHEY